MLKIDENSRWRRSRFLPIFTPLPCFELLQDLLSFLSSWTSSFRLRIISHIHPMARTKISAATSVRCWLSHWPRKSLEHCKFLSLFASLVKILSASWQNLHHVIHVDSLCKPGNIWVCLCHFSCRLYHTFWHLGLLRGLLFNSCSTGTKKGLTWLISIKSINFGVFQPICLRKSHCPPNS